MGKRIEDLPLDDTPIDSNPDVRDLTWFQFLRELDELIDSEKYGWAEDTLRGIYETIERTQRVTDGQRKAVANIEEKGSERSWNRSRRWRR